MKARESSGSLHTFYGRQSTVPAALSPAQAEEQQTRRLYLRMLVHTSARVHGANPHMSERLLGDDSGVVDATAFLRSHGVSLFTSRTMRDDLEKAFVFMKTKTVDSIKGTFGSIVADVATFSKEKVFVILYESPALPYDVLLKLVTPTNMAVEDDDWADHRVSVSVLHFCYT